MELMELLVEQVQQQLESVQIKLYLVEEAALPTEHQTYQEFTLALAQEQVGQKEVVLVTLVELEKQEQVLLF